MDRVCALESPGARGFSRKPFGELTNNWSNNATASNHAMNTPIKELSAASQEEALTPMANLKMLIRVASETDQLPSKRELFRDYPEHEIENENDDLPADLSMKSTLRREKSTSSLDHDYWTSMPGYQQENLTPSGVNCSTLGPPKISRKQKSLGLLCEKFIRRFPESVAEGDKCEIPLDDLAKSMSTERRRIYDIVNVLEAVQMMTKVGKNLYQWHGTTYRLATLAGLRQLALNLKLLDRYNEVKLMEENDPGCGYSVSPPSSGGTPKGVSPFTPTYSPCSSSSGPSPSPAERQTSLGVACQKFLMLFLITPEPNSKINLEFAAKVIHGPVLPEAVMKTRIRRLYDIANILQSLQLIRKVQVTETNGGKKPAFEYTGPDVDRMEVSQEILQSLPSTRQRNSLLAVGKNLANIPDDDPRVTPVSGIPYYKKRFSISSDYHDEELVPEHLPMQRENKIPRTSMKENSFISMARSVPMENEDARPQNLTIQRQRETSNSLMDLSVACEKEREQFHLPRHIPLSTSLSSSLSSFSSSTSSLNSVSSSYISRSVSFPSQPFLVKKQPLQLSSIMSSNPNIKVVHLGAHQIPSSRWNSVGFNRSKTVIALVSPTNPASGNCYPASGNCYPAVQTSPVSLVMKKSTSFN